MGTTLKTHSDSTLRVKLFLSCAFFIGCLAAYNADARSLDQSPILYFEGKTLAEVTVDGDGTMVHCTLYELEKKSDADRLIQGRPTKHPTFKEMLQLINNCTRLEVPHQNTAEAAPSSTTDGVSIWSMVKGIIPGTKWCGIGDIAESFEDLGPEVNVDICCRAHDFCPVKLKALKSEYGLVNWAWYTKSHCDCDRDFYDCLKQAGNKFAQDVGEFYFNIFEAECIQGEEKKMEAIEPHLKF